MKCPGRPSPFHLFTNPCVINWFVFGQEVVINYLGCITNSIAEDLKVCNNTILPSEHKMLCTCKPEMLIINCINCLIPILKLQLMPMNVSLSTSAHGTL